jgi:hypothetical protein
VGKYGLDSSGPGQGTCEHGSKTPTSVKMPRISLLDDQLLISQEGLCSMEFVTFLPDFSEN